MFEKNIQCLSLFLEIYTTTQRQAIIFTLIRNIMIAHFLTKLHVLNILLKGFKRCIIKTNAEKKRDQVNQKKADKSKREAERKHKRNGNTKLNGFLPVALNHKIVIAASS